MDGANSPVHVYLIFLLPFPKQFLLFKALQKKASHCFLPYSRQKSSFLNSQSCVLKHGSTLSNHFEVIILWMKSLASLKDQVKSFLFKNVYQFSLTAQWHIQSCGFFLQNVNCSTVAKSKTELARSVLAYRIFLFG